MHCLASYQCIKCMLTYAAWCSMLCLVLWVPYGTALQCSVPHTHPVCDWAFILTDCCRRCLSVAVWWSSQRCQTWTMPLRSWTTQNWTDVTSPSRRTVDEAAVVASAGDTCRLLQFVLYQFDCSALLMKWYDTKCLFSVLCWKADIKVILI